MKYIIIVVQIAGGSWHEPIKVQITNQKPEVFRTLADCQTEIAAKRYDPRTHKCIEGE